MQKHIMEINFPIKASNMHDPVAGQWIYVCREVILLLRELLVSAVFHMVHPY